MSIFLILLLIKESYGLLGFLGDLTSGKLNNVCPTYFDYYFQLINPRCYFNPNLTPNFGIVMDNLFETYEKHSVITEDGYIINLFKIPRSNPKGVIVMQNPVASDALVYVAQGNTSYAYFFYNQGYEIWLSSTRGSSLSPNHVTLNQKDNKFWDWSYYEIGIYDTRSVLNYVRNETGSDTKIIYLGYSESGGEGLIYASLFPEEAKKNVDLFSLMAPATIFSNPIIDLIPLPIFQFFGDVGEFLLRILRFLLGLLHREGSLQQYSIESILLKSLLVLIPFKRLVFLVLDIGIGFTPSNDDPTQYYAIKDEFFRGTSIKNGIFYTQHIYDRKFAQYDYGKRKNLQLYGTAKAPEFPLGDIKAQVYIIGGAKDFFESPRALTKISSMIPRTSQIYGGPQFIDNFNHIDFAVGKERVRFYEILLGIYSKIQ